MSWGCKIHCLVNPWFLIFIKTKLLCKLFITVGITGLLSAHMGASTAKYLYWIVNSITHCQLKQNDKSEHSWTARTNLSQLQLRQYNSRQDVWTVFYLLLPLYNIYWLKRKIQLMFRFPIQVWGTMPWSVWIVII